MNLLDAQLTILWVRLNIATEGNVLMARLLDHGVAPFLSVKLGIGTFAAYILYRCAHLPMARRGMVFALTLYGALIGVHIVTGFSALGWQAPEIVLAYFFNLPRAVLILCF